MKQLVQQKPFKFNPFLYDLPIKNTIMMMVFFIQHYRLFFIDVWLKVANRFVDAITIALHGISELLT